MTQHIEFETPENIPLSYQPAGLGTRFLAWLVDSMLLTAVALALFFLFLCAGLSATLALDGLLPEFFDAAPGDAMLYFLGFWLLLWGLGSFVYFSVLELTMRGQTIGKRLVQIRVVKSEGFSLDAASILVRNIFRVIDHLPVLWIVPLLTKSGQRFGDLVAGTVVVAEGTAALSPVRARLADQPASESTFQFDAGALKRLRPPDITAVERLLERWSDLTAEQQKELLPQIVAALSAKTGVLPPPPGRELQFLEELLAAEYRRQQRQLG